MRWKPHVRFGGRAGETHPPKGRQGAPVRSHVANTALDDCRRRVQNETLGHRGRRDDPLWRARRRLSIAREPLSADQHERLMGLRAGDPHHEVWFA
jgi:transposase